MLSIVVALSISTINCGPQKQARKDDEEPVLIQEVRQPDGKLLETKSYYVDSSGRKIQHGPDISYFDDGKRRLEVNYDHGRLQGVLTEWDPYEGDKVREQHFKDGLQDGPSTTWYSPKQKRSECTYKDGKIDGKQLYWNSHNGGLQIEEISDADGELVEGTMWHDNGQKKLHGYFKGAWDDVWGGPWLYGKRDGEWTYWDDKGKVITSGVWNNGKPWEGTCIVPRQSGSLWVGERGTYHGGQLVGSVTRQLDF